MQSLNQFTDSMRYYCAEISLGYDQRNRQDFREGGECDCSSLVIRALQDCGFDTGSASYTGNLSRNLTARGWQRRAFSTSDLMAGDILLNDSDHVAVYLGDNEVAEAAIDENGNAYGGQGGDQNGNETRIRGIYDYPWDCILRYVCDKAVIVWDFNGGENQQWRITDTAIQSRMFPDCVLTSEASEQGAPIRCYRDLGEACQRWTMNGGKRWHTFVQGEHVLDIAGTLPERGAIAELWGENGGTNQQFCLIPTHEEDYVYIAILDKNGFKFLDVSLS